MKFGHYSHFPTRRSIFIGIIQYGSKEGREIITNDTDLANCDSVFKSDSLSFLSYKSTTSSSFSFQAAKKSNAARLNCENAIGM